MARPQRQIVSADPQVAAFAHELRDLRTNAGRTLDQLSKQAHYSISALSEATSGKRLPTWELTKAYVEACEGDLGQWKRRWTAVAGPAPGSALERGPGDPDITAGGVGAVRPHQPRRVRSVGAHRAPLLALGLLACFIVVTILVFAYAAGSEAAPRDYPHTLATVIAGKPPTTAAARWYTSGVFLGAASALAGVLGVLGTLRASRGLLARRLLTYRLIDSRPLPQPGAQPSTRHVPRHAATKTTPESAIVTIKVANRSRRDIPSRAFDQQRPLRLDVNAEVLKIVEIKSRPEGFMVPRIEADGTAVALGPSLIKTRQTITFSAVISSGRPHLTVPEPSIVDTHIRGLGERRLTHMPAWATVLASTVVFAGVSLRTAGVPRP